MMNPPLSEPVLKPRPTRRERLLSLAHRALRRWRGRASKWHRGLPHHEVICSYEEWAASQSRAGSRLLRQERASR